MCAFSEEKKLVDVSRNQVEFKRSKLLHDRSYRHFEAESMEALTFLITVNFFVKEQSEVLDSLTGRTDAIL